MSKTTFKAGRSKTNGYPQHPSVFTFGHYKAGIQDKDIALFDAAMRSLPYEHGFAPDLWKEIVDVEILKKAGVYIREGGNAVQ